MSHLSWDQQIAAGYSNVQPCKCWHNGYEGRGSAETSQHPGEWEEGAQSAYERAHDC